MFFTKIPQSIFLKEIEPGIFTCMHTDTISKVGDYDRMQETRKHWRRVAGCFGAFIIYIGSSLSLMALLNHS